MLYRFKCKATGDVVMLEPNGKQVLEILGKDPAGPGIILLEQMPAAVAALHAAVKAAEEEHARQVAEAREKGEPPPDPGGVSLRMRVAPFLEMIQRCEAERVEIVWGV